MCELQPDLLEVFLFIISVGLVSVKFHCFSLVFIV